MRISDWSSDVCSSDLPTSEWSPAIWFAFDHKDAPQAYQLMLFQDSDGSIRPEIRLLDVADQRDHVSIEPDIHFAAVDIILVEIEVHDQDRKSTRLNSSH